MDIFQPKGNSFYYTDEFRNIIEDHLNYIRNHKTTIAMRLETHDMIKNNNDLYSLFMEKKIPMDLHWITLRLNNLTSPFLNRVELEYILIPDAGIIGQIFSAYHSRK